MNNKLVHRDEPRSIRPSVSVNNKIVHRDEPRSISQSASMNKETFFHRDEPRSITVHQPLLIINLFTRMSLCLLQSHQPP